MNIKKLITVGLAVTVARLQWITGAEGNEVRIDLVAHTEPNPPMPGD